MTFVLQMMSALMEPVGVIGYVLCGLLLPRLWLSLPVAVLWAVAMQVWETAQTKAQHGMSALELLFPRIAVALLIAIVASMALEAVRVRVAEFHRPATRS